MRDLTPTDPYNLAPQYILDRLEIPEENFYQFTIEGIPCQILRHPKMGFLLGYILVYEGHPWHGLGSDALYDVEVHGGVTWTQQQEGGDGWVIGFDCAHCDDINPRLDWLLGFQSNPKATYRTVAYVYEELKNLARQVREAQGGLNNGRD